MAVEGAARSAHPGRIGKYEIVSKIGQGAMGEVYKARDTVLDRFVAIKTMSPAVLGNPEMGQRFLREAQSAARLNHPNIVTLHDFGEDAGQYYMAMELLDGEDLSRALRRGALPTLEDKLAVMEQILDGVAYAHNMGVIHRDLKPPNIHVQQNGHIKVMDFGLARLGESEITRAGTVMGTPNYMSPEQVRGEKTGPGSDVFSLGAMFYEVISGQKAFDADSMHAVLYRVTESNPAPLTEICEGVPPVIVTFVWRALAKAPELRYRDAAQMRDALDLCRRVFDGSMEEAAAIAAMGEAPTILQTPGEAAATALWTDLGAQNPATSPQSHQSIRPTGQGSLPGARPTSSPTIRKAGRPAAKPPTGSGVTPAAPVTAAPPASRTGLFVGLAAVGAIAIVALAVLLRQPAPQTPIADDRQTRAALSLAIEAQLDSARRSLEYKDPEGAIAAAQKALQFDPANKDAQDITSRARAVLDGVESDAREARRAAEAGDLDAASRALAKVLDVMPKHPVAAELSTQLASRFQARADEAKKEASRAGDAARRAGASSLRAYAEGTSQTGIAQAAYGRKQFTEAAQHFAEARRAFEVATRDAADLAARKAAAPSPSRAVEATPAVVAAAPTAIPLPATPAPTPMVAAPTAAPVATPPPLPRPAVDEDAAVRQVVARLKQAIEQKDLALYKRLRPDLTADEERRLRDAFQNVTSQQVEYAIESVTLEGSRATLRVTRTGRVSGQSVPAVRQVLRMTKIDGAWVISEIGQ